MFVNDIPEAELEQAVLLTTDALLIEAATALSADSDFIVVLDSAGGVRGVVTKTDLVKRMSVCKGAACQCPVSKVMTRKVFCCRGEEPLQEVAEIMRMLNFKKIVLVDEQNHFLGLLTARSIFRKLLGDARHKEDQLVDYLCGVGYR